MSDPTTGGFNHSGGTSSGTISVVTNQGGGIYTATFTGQTAGTATTLGATIGGNAVTVAETGHLAFGTLHTNSAVQTINRVVDVFPPYQQPRSSRDLASHR